MDYKNLIENQDFSSPAKIADWIWDATCAINDLLARAEAAEAMAEKAERERDAAIKELDGVFSAVDDLDEFIDDHVHPFAPYDVYRSLRDNVEAVSVWRYEKEWRGEKEE